MNRVILVMGARVVDSKPHYRFKLRLDEVLKHFEFGDKVIVSGRASSTLAVTGKTEAEVGMEYLVTKGKRKEDVFMETAAVESLGNIVFSKYIVDAMGSEDVMIITSDFVKPRTEYYVSKFFNSFNVERKYVDEGIQSDHYDLMEKREVKALAMYKKLLENVEENDHAAALVVLLTKTPFYNKNYVDDKIFFDEYWEGGFEDYINGRKLRNIEDRKVAQ